MQFAVAIVFGILVAIVLLLADIARTLDRIRRQKLDELEMSAGFTQPQRILWSKAKFHLRGNAEARFKNKLAKQRRHLIPAARLSVLGQSE